MTVLGAGGAGGAVGRRLQASVHLVVQRREVLQRRLWLSQVVHGHLKRRQNPAIEFVQDRKKRWDRRLVEEFCHARHRSAAGGGPSSRQGLRRHLRLVIEGLVDQELGCTRHAASVERVLAEQVATNWEVIADTAHFHTNISRCARRYVSVTRLDATTDHHPPTTRSLSLSLKTDPDRRQ